jgi:hypothetical protein
MIRLVAGLKNSLIVLEHLRVYEDDLEGISISVGAFTNCREQGLTFQVWNSNTGEYFTYCIYEHRNSDQIIINGKEGIVSLAGDLPYAEGNKYGYIESFPYNAHYECAEYLKDHIVAFAKTKHKAGKK